jgi:cytoskeletal protein RodZ
MTFGEALRKARLELGLSQDGFSKATGLHHTYISLLE